MTLAPIFSSGIYFRWKYLDVVSFAVSLSIYIWVRVENSLLQQLNCQRISCNSNRLQKGCESNWGDQLTRALKKWIQIFLLQSSLWKYLYISNLKLTMKGCPENFVIFWCFSVHDMNHMWFEFRSSPTTPSWFFTEKSKKYIQYLTFLTNRNIWHKIWLILHHPKKFEHNWIKNGPAVRFYFWTLFANLNFLNFIACAIVQCVCWRKTVNCLALAPSLSLLPFWGSLSRICPWNYLGFVHQII